MENERLRWVNAAKLLAENKNAEVLCPSCGQALLTVKDVPLPEQKKINRFLVCNTCGKFDLITGNFDEMIE